MLEKYDRCDKCKALCIEKDNRLLGPLEGRYEYLCRNCAFMEGLVYPLVEAGARPQVNGPGRLSVRPQERLLPRHGDRRARPSQGQDHRDPGQARGPDEGLEGVGALGGWLPGVYLIFGKNAEYPLYIGKAGRSTKREDSEIWGLSTDSRTFNVA
jgi:hypothetical protein